MIASKCGIFASCAGRLEVSANCERRDLGLTTIYLKAVGTLEALEALEVIME